MKYVLGENCITYKSAIVDELDNVMYWCDDLSAEEMKLILSSHPEWAIEVVEL